MTTPLNESAVDVTYDDGVLRVQLNRPEASNATTLADLEHIAAVLVEAPVSTRVAVFSGSGGKSFCAGMHLEAMPGLTHAQARRFIEINRDILGSIRKAPFATVTRVQGYCLGTGLGIALTSDFRIVSTGSVFGLPEVKAGVPCVCDTALLSQFVGLGVMKEMMLTGENFAATDDAMRGLSNRLVAPDDVDAEIEHFISTIKGLTPTVVAAQKRLFETWQNTPLVAGIETSLEVFAGVFADQETDRQAVARRRAVGGSAGQSRT